MSDDAKKAFGESSLRVQSHGHWLLYGIAQPSNCSDRHATAFTAPADGKGDRVVRQETSGNRGPSHSLPAERDSFVGRQESLGLLAKKLQAGTRLVSVLAWAALARLPGHAPADTPGRLPGRGGFVICRSARRGRHCLCRRAGLKFRWAADPVTQPAGDYRSRPPIVLDTEQVAKHAEETLGIWPSGPRPDYRHDEEVLGIIGEEIRPAARSGRCCRVFLRADAAPKVRAKAPTI